ncbi:MAG: zf-HC2 domain-containing protein [Kineothrix sp.]|nr:zf-HC2 domain-containing protein [Kineothrix sp.]
MEQRLVCDTVRDLLPMYIDQMTSDTTNRSMEEHMESCGECRAVMEQMKQPVQAETAPEVKEFKKFLKESKKRMRWFYWFMAAAAMIAVLTCFIVNLATEKGLSWFYIVCMGIGTAYFPAYVFIVSHKHKFEKALAALSVCVIGLVGTVQVVLYHLMGIGDIWFWKLGLPIVSYWLVAVWMGVFFRIIFHCNWLYAIAVIALLAIPGNYYTNRLVGCYEGIFDFFENFISNGLGNLLLAIILLCCAKWWDR